MNDGATTPSGPVDEVLSTENEVKVLLVNRRDIVRRGLRAVIEDSDDLVVVGDAPRIDRDARVIDQAEADVAILDGTEPPERVMDMVEAIRDVQEDVPVLVLGSRDARETKRAAAAAGADGYLLDDAGERDVLEVVRQAARGERTDRPEAMQPHVSPTHQHVPPDLTRRERQVLHFIAAGMTNRQIGNRLGLAEKTIKNYVSTLLSKLHLESRTQAAVYRATHPEITHSGGGMSGLPGGPSALSGDAWRTKTAPAPSAPLR